MKEKNCFLVDKHLEVIILITVILFFLAAVPVFALEIVSLPIEKSEKDVYQLEADIPILINLDSKEIQEKYNNLFRDNILTFIEYTIEMAKDNEHSFEGTDFPKREFVGKVNFDLKNSDKILSIKINYYQYTGGAHGNPYSLSYNIDLTTGKDLELVDFLQKQNMSLKDVEAVIKSEIENQPEIFFQSNDYSFQELAADQFYYLEEDKIVIYFQPYAIAPYSSGMPEFKIEY